MVAMVDSLVCVVYEPYNSNKAQRNQSFVSFVQCNSKQQQSEVHVVMVGLMRCDA